MSNIIFFKKFLEIICFTQIHKVPIGYNFLTETTLKVEYY